MNKWRRFWNLSPPERWILLEALALLPATALSLRLAGFSRTQAALARLAVRDDSFPGKSDRAALEHAQRIARLVAAAAREGLRESNCLERSLTLWWLLQRRDIACQIRIGARKSEGKFEAHAWIDFDGAALNESEEVHRHFKPFERDLASLGVETR